MTTDCVQGLRYKLQKRYRKVRAAPRQLMAIALKQFWRFVQAQPILVGIMEDLARRSADAEASAREMLFNLKPA